MEYNDLNNTIAYSITSTIFRHGTIPDDTAYFQLTPLSLLLGNYMTVYAANLSRDAKSCVSQANIRHLLG